MSKTNAAASTIEAIEASVISRYGSLPPGWGLAQLYKDAPYVFVLECADCNTGVGRWQVLEAQLPGFGNAVTAALTGHEHWIGWAAALAASPESRVTIHDAVRGTLDAIKAQRGGSLPDGLEIRHTSSTPYTVGLWCQQCDGYVRQWTTVEPEFVHIMTMVAVYAYYHACWRPKPAEGAGTEGTETPKPATRAAHFREAAALLRAYPDYPGVMNVAAGILENHAEMPHVYKSLLCESFDHALCAPDGYAQCKACKAPCSCRCHGGRS